MNRIQKLYILLWYCFIANIIFVNKTTAQDAIFTTFHSNKSFYNPAAVGLNNSLAFRSTYKSQWNTIGDPPYESILLSLEDAMPCSNLDWGISLLSDTEGAGIFRTIQGGLKLAYSLSDLAPKLTRQHNFRFGFDWSFGRHSVDYTKLTFSDNIDPKYGFINPTSFVAPNDGNSPIFFNPALGFMIQSLWDRKSAQSISTAFGFSMSNAFSLGGDDFGQSSSVLGLKSNTSGYRYSFFGEVNLLPRVRRNFISSISPLFFYQYQSGIHYWEIGSAVKITPIFEVGIYTHNTSWPLRDRDTGWLSATTSIMLRSSNYSRVQLDMTYSTNYKGLQNLVGPIFEVGVTIHLAKSLGCRLFGKGDEVFYSEGQKCPIMKISRARKKMYENVWYKN